MGVFSTLCVLGLPLCFGIAFSLGRGIAFSFARGIDFGNGSTIVLELLTTASAGLIASDGCVVINLLLPPLRLLGDCGVFDFLDSVTVLGVCGSTGCVVLSLII